jgi:ACS family pantothenate transporter-like MFS transporter
MGLLRDKSRLASGDEESSLEVKKASASWKGYLWDTFDLPKDERKLLFKLDAIVLTFASVSAT